MTELTATQKTILLEPIKMINVVAERMNEGDDTNWCRGMLRHHIPNLVGRSHRTCGYDFVAEYISNDGLIVIANFIRRYNGDPTTKEMLEHFLSRVESSFLKE